MTSQATTRPHGETRVPGQDNGTDLFPKIPPTDDPRNVQCIRRGPGLELRLVLTEYRGHARVDLRWYFQSDAGEWRPTRHGITVPVAKWGEFFEVVVELDRRLIEAGIVKEAADAD